MAVTPTRNLPPNAEPWGRWVEAELRKNSLAETANTQNINNTLNGVNGSLRKLGEQVAEIALVADQAAAAAATAGAAAAAAGAAAAQANAAVADLAARVSITASIASFNTGALPNDSIEHPYGAGIPITVNVPTGKLIVTVGCGQVTVDSGPVAASGAASFSLPGYANLGDYVGIFYDSGDQLIGGSVSVTRAFTVTPGVHTITGQMLAWAAGTGASVQFTQPYLTVQVTG